MSSRLVLPSLITVLLVSRALGALTYEPVYSFSSAARSSPQGEIYIDSDLNIYGTTYGGGIGNGGLGNGVVYKIDRNGTATNLVEFTGVAGAAPGRGSR